MRKSELSLFSIAAVMVLISVGCPGNDNQQRTRITSGRHSSGNSKPNSGAPQTGQAGKLPPRGTKGQAGPGGTPVGGGTVVVPKNKEEETDPNALESVIRELTAGTTADPKLIPSGRYELEQAMNLLTISSATRTDSYGQRIDISIDGTKLLFDVQAFHAAGAPALNKAEPTLYLLPTAVDLNTNGENFEFAAANVYDYSVILDGKSEPTTFIPAKTNSKDVFGAIMRSKASFAKGFFSFQMRDKSFNTYTRAISMIRTEQGIRVVDKTINQNNTIFQILILEYVRTGDAKSQANLKPAAAAAVTPEPQVTVETHEAPAAKEPDTAAKPDEAAVKIPEAAALPAEKTEAAAQQSNPPAGETSEKPASEFQ